MRYGHLEYHPTQLRIWAPLRRYISRSYGMYVLQNLIEQSHPVQPDTKC